MDYFGAVSNGTYANPAVTTTERAALAASFGLLIGPLATGSSVTVTDKHELDLSLSM